MEKEQNTIPVNIDFNAKIHNRFDIEVRDAKTGELKKQARAFNVICNALWTRFFGGNDYFNYIIYGSGTGTPTATDTALFHKINALGPDTSYGNAFAGYTSRCQYDIIESSGNMILSFKRRIVIDTETSNGSTITEVGIGYDTTHIVTHAMLQDMNGNPISIAKTNTDIIYIYATIYVHYSAYTISKDKFLVGGKNYRTTHNLPVALAGLTGVGNNDPMWFSPGVTFDGNTNTKTGTVTKNISTKTISSFCHILANEGNYSEGIVTTAFMQDSVIFDVSKCYNLNNFAITGEPIGSGDGTANTFKSKFPINSSAKVYIDGVEQISGVTILEGKFKEFYKLHLIFNESGYLMFPYISVYDNNNYFIIENDINATFTGLQYVKGDSTGIPTTIYGSDDSISGPWTSIASSAPGGTGTKTISFPNATNYRYYKITLNQDTYNGHKLSNLFLISPSDKTYNIIFDTPPASGSVITIDYVPDCIPKDNNHVLDLTLSITLGEYSGN